MADTFPFFVPRKSIFFITKTKISQGRTKLGQTRTQLTTNVPTLVGGTLKRVQKQCKSDPNIWSDFVNNKRALETFDQIC